MPEFIVHGRIYANTHREARQELKRIAKETELALIIDQLVDDSEQRKQHAKKEMPYV